MGAGVRVQFCTVNFPKREAQIAERGLPAERRFPPLVDPRVDSFSDERAPEDAGVTVRDSHSAPLIHKRGT